MNITEYVKDKINSLSKGYVFTYADFTLEVSQKEAVIKVLNRLAASGKIAKLSKGKFYKAEQSPFGELPPNERQIVKDYLEKDGKIMGYLTGYSVYNQLGLSSQVGNIIQIGTQSLRPATKRGKYKIVFVRQKNTITKENIPLFQLLDAIRNIKKIPDATVTDSVKRMMAIIKKLPGERIETLLRLALKYPPSARALLGAVVEKVRPKADTSALLNSLNPITQYNIGIKNKRQLNNQKWNLT